MNGTVIVVEAGAWLRIEREELRTVTVDGDIRITTKGGGMVLIDLHLLTLPAEQQRDVAAQIFDDLIEIRPPSDLIVVWRYSWGAKDRSASWTRIEDGWETE